MEKTPFTTTSTRRAKGIMLTNVLTLAVVVSVRWPFNSEEQEKRAGTITIKTNDKDEVISAHADIKKGYAGSSIEDANAVALAIEEICINELSEFGYELAFEDFTVDIS